MNKRLRAKTLRNKHWRKNSYIHAKRRLKERYGIELDKDTFGQMIKDIRKHKGDLTVRKTYGDRILKYVIDDTNVYIAYSESLQAIKTFLTPDEFYNEVFVAKKQKELVLDGELDFFYLVSNNEREWRVGEPFYIVDVSSQETLAKARVTKKRRIGMLYIISSKKFGSFEDEYELIRFLKANHDGRYDKSDKIIKIRFELEG